MSVMGMLRQLAFQIGPISVICNVRDFTATERSDDLLQLISPFWQR